jgi:hypothetical protein
MSTLAAGMLNGATALGREGGAHCPEWAHCNRAWAHCQHQKVWACAASGVAGTPGGGLLPARGHLGGTGSDSDASAGAAARAATRPGGLQPEVPAL